MDWKDGLTQSKICETLVSNGKALNYLGNVMERTAQENYLPAVTRKAFLEDVSSLDPSFEHDIGTALVLECHLRNSDKTVVYRKREVGSLIIFPRGNVSTEEGVALVDFLLKVPSMMTLNPAQVIELEYLLNKAGETLGFPMPTVRSATEYEKKAILNELASAKLRTKPRAFYRDFMDAMKAQGIPVSMTQKQFSQFAEENLIKLTSVEDKLE